MKTKSNHRKYTVNISEKGESTLTVKSNGDRLNFNVAAYPSSALEKIYAAQEKLERDREKVK